MTEYQRHYRSEVRINLDHLRSNTRWLMHHCPSGTKQMAVVKANAYGHGAREIANALTEIVDWFAVATVHEGIELRDAGIESPILVLGPPHKNTITYYPQYGLTATVSDLGHIELLHLNTDYHVNINTGMNRMGVSVSEIDELMSAIKRGNGRLTGLMTHFATADEPDSKLVYEQHSEFQKIRERFESNIIVHVANTGALSFYDDMCFDMVRTGIGMYGYAPGETPLTELIPILSWITKVEHTHFITKGESVSYGATWRASQDGWIATLPIGYADGVPRMLSNRFNVRAGDRLVPCVGTVTMDYIMIYLGEEPVPIGTEVEVMGRNAMDAGEWAELCATIPYEILTGINDRVKRSYVET